MRVIVSVKPTPGGGQTSRATRYNAYRERDEERQGKEPRPLFSAGQDGLSFWKAERVLTEGRAPTKDELIHVVVSFREEDFKLSAMMKPNARTRSKRSHGNPSHGLRMNLRLIS